MSAPERPDEAGPAGSFAAPAALLGAGVRAAAAGLDAGLFPHQVEGVAFLLERRRAILADDMGLGKTRQAVVAMREAAPAGPWLVVCPASVKHSWAREIALAGGREPVLRVGPAAPPAPGHRGWLIVNYELLRRHGPALAAQGFAGYVLDEAHYLKNYRSRRSRAARALLALAPPEAPVYVLTGTPLTNRPRDLFPLLQIIGHPLGRDFLAFAQRYCDARHNGFGWVTDGASNLEELTVRLHGALLRREKTRVLSLPPKLVAWREVDLPHGVAQRQTRLALAALLQRARARRRGRRGGVRPLAHLTTARRLLALAKAAVSQELAAAAVDQGEKVLVYSCFSEPLRRIARHFGAQGLLLTGRTPPARRQALVDRFQQDPGIRVLAANLLAGGVGLNLTAARQVVFNDLDWVPAHHWQAEDRACRIGQRWAVNVHYVLARGSLDEFVAATLESKRRLIAAVVDGEALGEGAGDALSELEAALRQVAPGLVDQPDADLEALDLTVLLGALLQQAGGSGPSASSAR